MSQIPPLYKLQEIDTEISQKKQLLGEVLRAQKETPELLQARQAAQEAAEELSNWKATDSELRLERDGIKSKAKRSEDRLYSGKVTNPKELSDIQQEIESLGRRRGAVEDKMLEAMIMIEDAETAKTAADEHLGRTEADWKKSQASLAEQQTQLALRLRDLMAERQKQIPLLSAKSLAAYERVGKQHNGLAVVLLKGNMCQGCRLNVSANTVKSVNEGGLVFCEKCGRILAIP